MRWLWCSILLCMLCGVAEARSIYVGNVDYFQCYYIVEDGITHKEVWHRYKGNLFHKYRQIPKDMPKCDDARLWLDSPVPEKLTRMVSSSPPAEYHNTYNEYNGASFSEVLCVLVWITVAVMGLALVVVPIVALFFGMLENGVFFFFWW